MAHLFVEDLDLSLAIHEYQLGKADFHQNIDSVPETLQRHHRILVPILENTSVDGGVALTTLRCHGRDDPVVDHRNVVADVEGVRELAEERTMGAPPEVDHHLVTPHLAVSRKELREGHQTLGYHKAPTLRIHQASTVRIVDPHVVEVVDVDVDASRLDCDDAHELFVPSNPVSVKPNPTLEIQTPSIWLVEVVGVAGEPDMAWMLIGKL